MAVEMKPGWFNVGTLKEDFDISYSGEGKTWTTLISSSEVEWKQPADRRQIDPEVEVQKCPHCNRDWHPEPLTQTVASMLARHEFSLDYDPDTDDSDIVCIGANYEGPKRPPRRAGLESPGWTFVVGNKQPGAPTWLGKLYEATANWLDEITLTWNFTITPTWTTTWTTTVYTKGWKPLWASKPEPCEMPDELPDVKFEPAHWNITTDHWVSPQHTELVSAYWHDFHANPTPIPESPGMDFSQYDTGEISYPTSGKKGKK